MGEKDDYLTTYRVFFENFAANVDPEDQLPVNIAGYTISEAELPGEVIYWTTQYLSEKECPLTLMTPLQRIILDEVHVARKQSPNEFGYDPEISEYLALRLMQAVTARVNDVCLRYLDNAQLDTLPPPPPPSMRQFLTAASVTKNLRRAMEDRHFEIGNLEALFGIETTEPTSFYGVYDGHAGSAAAVYCAAHLHQYLVESPHFTTDLRRALEDAFLRTDAEFIRKTNQKRVSGGSTAVVICVRGRKLVAAWAGDSLALLAKRLKLMQLVHPHKPDRPDEKQRIVSSGGEVRFWGTWRVDGQLAVSRAIGDAQYKPYVTAQPETAEVELDGDEDFVVVACDGLWDFVSEDVVALVVYKQLVNDSNDLKEVTKNLVRQAKRQGSQDNISVIVVFLKEPRDIAAENTAPMEIGLDNPVVNPPPFSVENDVCKVSEGTGGCADVENDVSDSDSDDLGPETAVDIDADELDADARREPAAPTPPAHTVEESHIDGNLVDNVAESGEESEDEWNYYKGEGEREDNPGEEIDDVLRSETPGHDHSAWESSSVDMNSSPLNPDAPVFVPGSVAGCDQLLAESPRKPLPMDDIELPDVAQFQTEAHIRPAELHDLDDCDQLNGHHNLSMEGVTEHMNGNSKNNMDSLGFGFNLGIEQDKIKETSLIQDFERIQKDTTDFCNIQVFQAHETNPFSRDGDNQLFERLKNKESDPMSMSFYQEKDDDTCDRFNKPSSQVDLNAVQLLPESDDEDIPSNGICQGVRDYEKENINPEFRDTDILDLNNGEEPNNDIMRFEDNAESLSNDFVNFNVDSLNNMQDYTNNDFECNLPQDSIVHTETPESHKLLFEQIPEIPDGKSSELGFSNEDNLDVSESEKDARVLTPQDETSQDVQMDSKIEDSTSEGINQDQIIPTSDLKNSTNQCSFSEVQNDFGSEISVEELEITQKNALKPEAVDQDEQFDTILGEVNHENIVVDVHQDSEIQQNGLSEEDLEIENISDQIGSKESNNESLSDNASLLPKSPVQQSSILSEENNCLSLQQESSLPISPKPSEEFVAHDVLQSPVPCESPVPYESEIHLEPSESHLTQDPLMEKQTLLPSDPCPLPSESPVHHKDDTLENFETNTKSPTLFNPKIDDASETVHTLISSDPSKSLVIEGAREPSPAPAPSEIPLPRESPIPSDSPQPEESQLFGSVMFSQSKSGVVASSNILVDEEELIESHDSINVKKESEELIADKITPVNTEIVTNLLGNEEIILETSKELSQNEFIHEEKDMKQPAQEVLIQNIISDVTRHDVISPNPIQDGITSQPVELVASPIPTPIDTSHEIEDIKQSEKLAMEGGAPTPDIVPEGHNRAEIITDIDIDISESHAQEICVPVTSEIQPNDAVMSGVTPSSTSDVENTHSSTEPLGDAPIAAPLVAAAAGAAAVAAIGAGVAKTKSGSPKKAPTAVPSKTTPKTTPKAAPTSSRTPASATKRPVSTTTAPRSPATTARPATARTPTSATKPIAKPTTKSTAPSPKPVASPTAPVAKTTSKPSQTLPSARSVAAPKPAAARASQKPSAPKPTVTATKTGTAPATKAAVPAPRAAPRPAPIRAPLSSAPPKPVKDLKLKAPEAKKPQTNGDVKISAKPAAARVPAARPQAPRPAPRVPSAAPVPAKPAAPKAPVRVALDKQSKDLANKRITAKAAPPRTATAKVPANTNNAPKPIKKVADKKAVLNGTASQKQPPSPPPTDNALLPDVIA